EIPWCGPIDVPISSPSSQHQCKICQKVLKKKGALTVHLRTHNKGSPKVRRRVKRMCPFCKDSQTNLKRHLIMKHNGKPEVTAILQMKLTPAEERKAFARIRNQGILIGNSEKNGENLERIHGNKSEYVHGDVVHCSVCQGAYSKTTFHRHRVSCQNNATQLKPEVAHLPHPKFAILLSKFQKNEIGDTCRSDSTIREFGWNLFQKEKTKVDKFDEVCKSVSADMRLLARLFCHLKLTVPDDVCLHDASDLLDRGNWTHLREVIDLLTSKESGEVKHGLKMAIYYILLKFADNQIGVKLTQKDTQGQTEEIQNFIKLLKHHENSYFGDAKYQINKSRQEKLRLPERMPEENAMRILRDHTVKRIVEIVKESGEGIQDPSVFVELRNLVASRLTLFNARRGGEATRLRIDHWVKRKQWIRKDQKDHLKDEEKAFFNDMEIMFSAGE
ncbi:hypothetical protein CAPTEDRAFT_188479, partial [Capitella teleta]